MADAASRHGARIEILAVPERALPLAWLKTGGRLNRLEAADLLVVDSIVAARSSPFISRLGAHRTVALLHQVPGGVDHSRLATALQRRGDLNTYRKAARLVVVSDYLAELLQREGFDRARIAVVPPGRDPEPAGSAESARDLRQGRGMALLCVSNWMRNKAIAHLLAALSRLPAETATLHLVGDDRGDPDYARELRRLLGGDDLRGRVIVHGSLPQATLAGLYRGADAFVLPSLHEAYGAACAEAMTAGLPVIASRTDNLPYLVRDGVDGILVNPGDVAGLEAAITALARDPVQRRQLGASARQRAVSFPSWEDSARRFFAVLREVAGAQS
jgi:glycosyltransferase involved in cell wall biosynthesis